MPYYSICSIVYGDLQYRMPFESLQRFHKHNYLCQSFFRFYLVIWVRSWVVQQFCWKLNWREYKSLLTLSLFYIYIRIIFKQVFKIERKNPEEKGCLNRKASWSDMSLFNNLRILVQRFKEVVLETSVLSIKIFSR